MILVFIEHSNHRIDDTALEALTVGRQLADKMNVPLHGALVGSAADEIVARAGEFGVTVLYAAELAQPDTYAPAAYAACLVELLDNSKPQAVIAAGTERGNEIMAHVAARANLPLAANCTDVQPGADFIVTRLRWGGSLLEEAKLMGTSKLLTIAPNSIPLATVEPTRVTVQPFAPQLSERDYRARVTARVETATGKVSLASARVVVGGGRGVGSAEGFRELEELADLLGGAVGGSRVVTGLGWRPHHDQIGQTGTRIAPELYISCGISGAIQHMVGAKAAKHILAINTDADAPIMSKADYVVIGDLHQVVPAIIAEIKARRG